MLGLLPYRTVLHRVIAVTVKNSISLKNKNDAVNSNGLDPVV